jgi:integrase/recombinase XerD
VTGYVGFAVRPSVQTVAYGNQSTRSLGIIKLVHGAYRAEENLHAYLRANPTEKLEALATLAPTCLQRGKFPALDTLMAMLRAASRD